MKLLTQKLKKQIPALYSTESIPLKEKVAVAKYFNPIGAGTWFVIEGEEQEDGDFLCFGLVELMSRELGYFSLKELKSIRLPFGFKIERDTGFVPKKVVNLEREA